jgi:hypothetical protein
MARQAAFSDDPHRLEHLTVYALGAWHTCTVWRRWRLGDCGGSCCRIARLELRPITTETELAWCERNADSVL